MLRQRRCVTARLLTSHCIICIFFFFFKFNCIYYGFIPVFFLNFVSSLLFHKSLHFFYKISFLFVFFFCLLLFLKTHYLKLFKWNRIGNTICISNQCNFVFLKQKTYQWSLLSIFDIQKLSISLIKHL